MRTCRAIVLGCGGPRVALYELMIECIDLTTWVKSTPRHSKSPSDAVLAFSTDQSLTLSRLPSLTRSVEGHVTEPGWGGTRCFMLLSVDRTGIYDDCMRGRYKCLHRLSPIEWMIPPS